MSLKEEDRKIMVSLDLEKAYIKARIEPTRQFIDKIRQYIADK